MTTNFNKETGVRFGVIQGNNAPYLLDDITSNGESLNYEEFRRELEGKIRAALEDVVDDYHYNPAKVVDGLDVDVIAEALLDGGLSDNLEFEEEEYDYEDGGSHYHLGYLGGAPLIWVIESPYVMRCRGCSPCVPGAGDLDSPSEGGEFAHCPSPDDMANDSEYAEFTYREAGKVLIGDREYVEVIAVPIEENFNG